MDHSKRSLYARRPRNLAVAVLWAMSLAAFPTVANAAANGDDAGLVAPLSRLWVKTFPGATHASRPPACADGVVYFALGSTVYAARESDGSALWTCAGETSFLAQPVIAGHALFAAGDDSQVYKIDLKDGSVVWKKPAGATVHAPLAAANGRIYLSGADGKVIALNAETGEAAWTFDTGGALKSSVTVGDDDNVCGVSENEKAFCLDGASGRLVWQASVSGALADLSPACGDNLVYVAADRSLCALNARNGSLRWQAKFAARIAAPPTAGPGVVFAATDDDHVSALSDRGRQLWSADSGSSGSAQPALAGNTLFVPGQHGALFAYAADSGNLIWDYAVQPAAPGSSADLTAVPFSTDHTLYVAATDGSLSAFQPQAADKTAPVIASVSPASGSSVGAGAIACAATVVDEGSGISPRSVSVTLDGKAQANARYVAAQNGIGWTVASADPTADGVHTMVMNVTDWKGNTTTKTWTFTVDSKVAGNTGAPANLGTHAVSGNSPWDDPNYPYPKPSTDPAERVRIRARAREIYGELMQRHQQFGGPMPPAPPPY